MRALINPHKNTLETEGSVGWSRVQPKTNLYCPNVSRVFVG